MRLCLVFLLAALPASTGEADAAVGLASDQRKRALYLADLLIGEGRLEEAWSWVREQILLDPGELSWTLRQARIHAGRREHGTAMRLYQEILTVRIDDVGLLIDLGRQAAAALEFEIAEEAFLKAREIDGAPAITAQLSDLAYRRGDEAEGLRWARIALEDMGTPRELAEKLLHLRLRARLGSEEGFDGEYARLYAANPSEAEILTAWSDWLIKSGYAREAREPLALLREGFPSERPRWLRLEAARLQAQGLEEELLVHLHGGMSEFPDEPYFPYMLGAAYRRARCWGCAELYLSSAAAYAQYEASAHAAIHDIRDEGAHWSGPLFRSRDSVSSSFVESGISYRGPAGLHRRVRAEAAGGSYRRKDGSASGTVAGLAGSIAWERRRWTAGVDADLRGAAGLSVLSPGVFGAWTPSERWQLKGEAWSRRLERNSASALTAGVLSDEAVANAHWKAASRLRLGLNARVSRLSLRAGGRGSQFVAIPEAALTLTQSPVYASLSYRFVHLNAASDADFARNLSLTPRARTHYGILSVGRRWLDGHLRTSGYIFSAEEPGRGYSFFKGGLVGFSLRADYFAGERWKLSVSYGQSREDFDGIGDRSQKIDAAVEWRWGGGVCPQGRHKHD